MQTEVILATSQRGEELRYVTEHFRDLQGLRSAPFWATALTLCAAERMPWRLPVVDITLLFLSLGWMFWSGRWYRRRYGVVKKSKLPVPSEIISILHPETRPHSARNWYLVYFLLLALLFHRLFSGHEDQFGLLAIAVFLLPRCFHPAPANGLIRLRRFFSIAGSIVISAMYFDYLFTRQGMWPYQATMFSILLMLDLYDHWLFTRLLSGGAAVEASHG